MDTKQHPFTVTTANLRVLRLLALFALACIVAILTLCAVRLVAHQRAISAEWRYLDALRKQMKLPADVDPIAFAAEQIERKKGQKISLEQLDNYVPKFDRAQVTYHNGRPFAKTYYFLPRNVDKHLFMGFSLTVRYSEDGGISSAVWED
jgi:hypothetical protein